MAIYKIGVNSKLYLKSWRFGYDSNWFENVFLTILCLKLLFDLILQIFRGKSNIYRVRISKNFKNDRVSSECKNTDTKKLLEPIFGIIFTLFCMMSSWFLTCPRYDIKLCLIVRLQLCISLVFRSRLLWK